MKEWRHVVCHLLGLGIFAGEGGVIRHGYDRGNNTKVTEGEQSGGTPLIFACETRRPPHRSISPLSTAVELLASYLYTCPRGYLCPILTVKRSVTGAGAVTVSAASTALHAQPGRIYLGCKKAHTRHGNRRRAKRESNENFERRTAATAGYGLRPRQAEPSASLCDGPCRRRNYRGTRSRSRTYLTAA